MQLNFVDAKTDGRFIMYQHTHLLKGNGIMATPSTYNTFVWNKMKSQKVWIDGIEYTFPAQTILPLTGSQHFRFEIPENLVAWQFNREFYCIVDHDKEVGCVGFLFFGIQTPLFIKLDEKETENLITMEKSIHEELKEADHFQGEMLRSLLKRLIIKTTRAGKLQTKGYHEIGSEKMNLIRDFSLLVEGHFKTEHEVKAYALLLHKSPKTLTNLFRLYQQPSPSKIIHNRILLEAKRLLLFTDKTVKEIGFELGYKNPEQFSRFFKAKTGISISKFRNT
ncbi:helix-turn-helix domain-containing protein [Zhouia sp. PK063]|uniref:helix-turn-helix domain-containing protein n=1 Tax=Zhouia sp. PK063 TaxID=3373602 RepID=UPI0037A14B16